MAKKTIGVDEMRNWANTRLRTSFGSQQGYREGICSAIAEILHRSGNYRGFGYLTVNDVPHGEKPGINLDPNGNFIYDHDERFKNTDNSRVFYY